MSKLYKTVIDNNFHVAFDADTYSNVSTTFHFSKGREFDQVILFDEDYDLLNVSSIFNHYVAVTRAKSKIIIIINKNNYNSSIFQKKY